MSKSLIDDAVTFMVAFAMIMPWTALATAEHALARVSDFAQASGVINVAVAADLTSSLVTLQEPDLGGTVAAFVTETLFW